jgi:glycosyltransferase involved in cell wall biosynthesis
MITVLIPSWKGADLLRVCVPSLQTSAKVPLQIIVILNEADPESIQVCKELGVEFISFKENIGTGAVDLAIPMIRYPYVLNCNSDMGFAEGWDLDLLEIINKFYPCSASCSLVEPVDTGNPVVISDNIGPFVPETIEKFRQYCKEGKYKGQYRISYTHPILMKTEDFVRTGYSDGFNPKFIPGYSLDDLMPFKLWKHHNERAYPIASGRSFVYHGISMTNNKLTPSIKAQSGWDEFVKITGMNVHQFRQKIHCFSEIKMD